MPELPEVETVRRGLAQSITGKKIESVKLRREGLRRPFPKNFTDKVEGTKITSIDRRAKYLLIHLNNKHSILAHLGMSGRITVNSGETNSPLNHSPLMGEYVSGEQSSAANGGGEKYGKHDHVIFHFSDGTIMIFNDARRFGVMDLCLTSELGSLAELSGLGPEPLSNNFNGEELYSRLKSKNVDMKAALMDQRVVAGLGNIYVCESLFETGISPRKKAGKMSLEKTEELVPNVKKVLNAAIESGGSTLRDYVQSTGSSGYFQHQFKVYGRENKPCYTCGTNIKRITQSGRSTFYCTNCQK